MKFTLSWLKDHLQTDASLEVITDRLTMIGLEVDRITDPARVYAPFTVGHVLSASAHPNADTLRVCVVDTGAGTVQVVCGAPNARPGMRGVFAPAGTTIPGTGLDLKPVKIRGVASSGMLCSEREMLLSDDHEGIIELPADAPIGAPFATVMGLDDPVIEIEITPNRPDCLGVRGIARDLAAAGLGTLKPFTPKTLAGDYDSPIAIDLLFADDEKHICPIFAGCYVRGVRNGPSADWMQRRLRAIGLRPISALVDITNYVSYDLGRPLHVYDADRLEGNIGARMGRQGEHFTALDGKDYAVDAHMCVIADARRVLGLGGIMGGEYSGAQDDTTSVFIECAYFDPLRTAQTGRRTGILSDARYRFERGVDPAFVIPGLDAAIGLLVDLCGGTPSRPVIAGAPPLVDRRIDFPFGEVKRLTGLDTDDKTIARTLQHLGFTLSDTAGEVEVRVPEWRPDVEGKADLVEEITRITGIDAVSPVALPRADTVLKPVLTTAQKRSHDAKRVLAARGMLEAMTYSFIAHDDAKRFGGGARILRLANPIAAQMSDMRPSLLPGLMRAAGRNHDRGIADLALFEVGQVFCDDTIAGQSTCASGVRCGTQRLNGGGRHWRGGTRPVDAFDAKADALGVIEAMGLDATKVQLARGAPSWFHPGRSGVIQLGPKCVLGAFGEVHPGLAQSFGMDGPLVAFEVMLDAIPAARRKARRSRAIYDVPDLQPVRRDFAFVVDETIEAQALVRAAAGVDRVLIEHVRVFDVFTGASIGGGKKSIAIEVTLQPRQATMTDAAIEAICAKIITAVEKATGGALRG